MNFQLFQLHPDVASGVAAAGFVTPTPIQKEAIPAITSGKDIMGIAQTGTGKTAAFVLPILHRLMQGPRGRLRALIIAPTRELAEQTHEAIRTLGRRTGLRSATVYGGVAISPQMSALKRGVDIVVACPGRLLDHINRRSVDLSRLEVLVIDEADQMFDMGFFPDIRRILNHLPRQRQTLLFSATMPSEIRRLAKEILERPVTVQIGMSAPVKTVSHALYPVPSHLKTALLMKILPAAGNGSVLVFTRTKHRAKRLGEQLVRAGYRASALQGNLSQGKRQAAMDGFRNGRFKVLVATDIAARGIDVSRVTHVINYDVPATPDAYIHRIGRTGRAEHTGDAFTFVTDSDMMMIYAIDRVIGSRVERRTLADFNYGTPASRNPGTRSVPRRAPASGRAPARPSRFHR
ncbi:MAG: DEAD/DEAH box helicase [Deltaproteobacteria bacterium]|nr:DEAD/DEAH box helicase [Deltaproteobacteria bacterium]